MSQPFLFLRKNKLADQLIQMENRLGAKLDTVEVQTEYIDEEETAP